MKSITPHKKLQCFRQKFHQNVIFRYDKDKNATASCAKKTDCYFKLVDKKGRNAYNKYEKLSGREPQWRLPTTYII